MTALFIGSLYVASVSDQLGQCASLLYRQLVGRNVFRSKLQSSFDRVFPDIVRQLGEAEDQIHADVADSAAAENPEGLHCSGGAMAAVHPSEDAVIERLDPHADSVHSRFEKSSDIFPALLHNVLRVHLHRELLERRLRADSVLSTPK